MRTACSSGSLSRASDQEASEAQEEAYPEEAYDVEDYEEENDTEEDGGDEKDDNVTEYKGGLRIVYPDEFKNAAGVVTAFSGDLERDRADHERRDPGGAQRGL